VFGKASGDVSTVLVCRLRYSIKRRRIAGYFPARI
jgi:hypothetical protein